MIQYQLHARLFYFLCILVDYILVDIHDMCVQHVPYLTTLESFRNTNFYVFFHGEQVLDYFLKDLRKHVEALICLQVVPLGLLHHSNTHPRLYTQKRSKIICLRVLRKWEIFCIPAFFFLSIFSNWGNFIKKEKEINTTKGWLVLLKKPKGRRTKRLVAPLLGKPINPLSREGSSIKLYW